MKPFLVYSEFYSVVIFLLSCADAVKIFYPLLEHDFLCSLIVCRFCILFFLYAVVFVLTCKRRKFKKQYLHLIKA